MKRKRAELQAELVAEAEAAVNELLDWQEQTAAPDLTQIEEVVLRLRHRLGEAMVQSVVANQEAVRPIPGPCCPHCHGEMHYKGRKRQRVESRAGAVVLQRSYYYCQTCRTGLFPPRPATAPGRAGLE